MNFCKDKLFARVIISQADKLSTKDFLKRGCNKSELQDLTGQTIEMANDLSFSDFF